MLRTILSAVAGVVVWIAVVSVMDIVMRQFWPDYAAVFKAMTFTLPMMIARLTESTVALVVAAAATARLSKGAMGASWLLAAILFLPFAWFHYTIWDKFPVWYHAFFLSSLVIVPVIVGSLARPKAA